MGSQKPSELRTEVSREEKIFWAIDEILDKAAPFILGFTVLYILAHLIKFLN